MKGSGFSSWPTAQARDLRSGDNPDSPRQTRKADQGWSQNLNDVAEMLWQTPVSDDAADRAVGKVNSRGEPKLSGQAHLWGTPKGSDGDKGGPNMAYSAGGIPLPAQAAQWTTPQSHDVTPRGSGQTSGKTGNAYLATDAQNWPTPAAHEPRLGVQNRTEGSKGSQISLSTIADRFSHPAPLMQPHGPTLSQLRPIWRPLRDSVIALHGRAVWRRIWKSRTKRRLNPAFVGWLMGWPPGHALCDCSAMEFTHWQQRMRFALSQLPTASGPWIWQPPMDAAPTVQTDLFGVKHDTN